QDVVAETDMTVVCTGDGRFVEVQGTAEREPFDRALLDELLNLAVGGCKELADRQQQALGQCRAAGASCPPATPASWPSWTGSWPTRPCRSRWPASPSSPAPPRSARPAPP